MNAELMVAAFGTNPSISLSIESGTISVNLVRDSSSVAEGAYEGGTLDSHTAPRRRVVGERRVRRAVAAGRVATGEPDREDRPSPGRTASRPKTAA